MLIGYVISRITTPVLVPRYIIGSLPALIVLAAMGYGRLGSSLRMLGFQLALICGLMLPVLAGVSYPRTGEDWRSLASYLEGFARPDDCLLLSRSFLLRPLEYYGIDSPACFFGSVNQAARRADSGRRLIAVVAHYERGLEGVKAALPGDWSPPTAFGDKLQLAVREPVASLSTD